jgi:fucose 4-O-acetylase-like acetyltransferase
MPPKTKQRLHEVDQLTGFTIILVVIGHLVATESPADNQWYDILRYIIYKFHMPLFMFLSGIIFSHTLYTRYHWQTYSSWVLKKTLRLAPGFIGIGLLIILAKSMANHFLHIENQPTDLLTAIVHLFLIPGKSPSGSLWYIYVLLEFYFVFPLLMPVIERSPWPILIITAYMHYLSTQHAVSQWLMAKSFCEFSWYFYLGILSKRHYSIFNHFIYRLRFLFAALFVLTFLSTSVISEKLSKSLISLLAIPTFFYWAGLLRTPWTAFFIWVGSYSFTIYLLNTIFIGTSKALLLKTMPWDGINFLLFFMIMLISGLFGPIFSHKWLLCKIPYINKASR